MELVVLGSGGFALGTGREVRHPAGYAVRIGADLVLLDLGFGDLRQLARAGLDPARVRDVFFTHLHPDHVGDLAALLFFLRYERRPASGTLRLFGPPGFKGFLARLMAAHRPWVAAKGYRLQVVELKGGDRVRGRSWALSCLRVPHSAPSLAYRMTDGRRSLVYSGDTGFDPGLAVFAAGCDLLVLECSAADGQARPGTHLTVSEALSLARLSNCRKTVFSHLGEGSAAALRRLRGLPERFVLAQDLARFRM